MNFCPQILTPVKSFKCGDLRTRFEAEFLQQLVIQGDIERRLEEEAANMDKILGVKPRTLKAISINPTKNGIL